MIEDQEKHPSQITNLNGGDCCSRETVTIPVALLSLLECQMDSVIRILPFLDKIYKEKNLFLDHEEKDKAELAAHIINLEEGAVLWKGAKEHFISEGLDWPEIKHHEHRNKPK